MYIFMESGEGGMGVIAEWGEGTFFFSFTPVISKAKAEDEEEKGDE
jgi:hypothetical protein